MQNERTSIHENRRNTSVQPAEMEERSGAGSVLEMLKSLGFDYPEIIPIG